MQSSEVTFNNNGIVESCETVQFDDRQGITINDLMFTLRNIKNWNARITLMEHKQFQLIRLSSDQFILAPIDWEGWDEHEADHDGVHNGSACVHNQHTEPDPAENW